MSPDRYRRMWELTSKAKLEPPITYTCPKCQYPGEIARACDVPGFCLYCGHAFARSEFERLTKAVLAQQDREAEQKVQAWRDSWIAPTTADENTLVECARGHTFDSAKHGNCPECESETDLSYELAKDDAAEAR